jgi:hypothetical protein
LPFNIELNASCKDLEGFNFPQSIRKIICLSSFFLIKLATKSLSLFVSPLVKTGASLISSNKLASKIGAIYEREMEDF